MDSGSSSSAASTSTAQPPFLAVVEPPRPEAGPLPSKRGEIGYDEAMARAEEGRSATPTSTHLPERHPEDRGRTSTSTNNAATTPTTPTPNAAATQSSASLPNSTAKTKRILGIFKTKTIPAYWGLRLTTLLACVAQFMLVAGTIVGWYFAVSKAAAASNNSSDNSDGSDTNDDGSNSGTNSGTFLGNASTEIFIHVVFGVATIVQLLFIERRIFKLRAQRYTYVHPGEILPSARMRQMGSDPALALSPWNRPPLPTYAAALAQSGVGTGDVEDHLIAAPPPPAYGNTRGSTFLLSGFLNENLRAQRPASQHSQMSERPVSRALSYKSVDEDWVHIQDAERAARLEETLARLENASESVAPPPPAVTRS
ncbi:hypothetical protein HMN09_00406000 [Mycena chlorophos]|uniref:Uncharacterized protein n=1 Tax=Mycena chlorophos TaxID=658473 RepID=A0A8H6TGB3_MYCCL|nr:hypothetical protein HMN09_00406000 [Mycena chlorophos]